jgi:hypothetical protein
MGSLGAHQLLIAKIKIKTRTSVICGPTGSKHATGPTFKFKRATI